MCAIKICVVEDCMDEALVLSEGLRLFGYNAVLAHTGRECLDICASQVIHLILLDVGLPDIDGYELCRQLKKNPRTADIPVIFVTARGSSEDVGHGYDLGAVEYVAKPYNLPIIIVHVEAALRTRQDYSGLVSGPYLLTDPVYTDPLTGLRNRRFLLERLQEEAEKAHRYRYPLSCLLLDFEDTSDEDAKTVPTDSDDLLVEAAMAMRNSSRGFDILARYDDTQLAAVLPHIHLPNAVAYANKIRLELDNVIKNVNGVENAGELCFGIVTCQDGHRAPTAEELLGESLRGLILAKSGAPHRISARLLSMS